MQLSIKLIFIINNHALPVQTHCESTYEPKTFIIATESKHLFSQFGDIIVFNNLYIEDT